MSVTSPTRFRLYLDESGDHTYRSLENPSQRYLSLTGCIFVPKDYIPFSRELEELKQKHFGQYPHRDPDDPIILHRKDIINRRGCFSLLKEPGLETNFNDDLLGLFEKTRFVVISVIIDKKAHLVEYGDAAFHPYHYCLAAILERYAGMLNHFNVRGDVMAESRGGTEDRQLTNAYLNIYFSGTLFRSSEFYQRVLTSKEVKLKPKRANVAGLQLCDLLAYPIKQGVLIEKQLIKDPGDVFGSRVYKLMEQKFNRHIYEGRVWGYGKIWLPKK